MPQGQSGWAARFCRIVEKILAICLANAAALGSNSVSTRHLLAGNGGADMTKIDKTLQTELEAAAFRRLVQHMRDAQRRAEHRPDEPGRLLPQLPCQLVPGSGRRARPELSKDGAREVIYGMPYKDWQAKHQKAASSEQQAAFAKAPKPHQH
jgi:hypothetical protein